MTQSITCQATPAFISWLSAARGSLAVTTYQAGKLVLIGAHAKTLEVVMREFDKPLGLDFRDDQLVLACRHSATVFANAPLLATEYLVDQPGRYDALYLPRVTHYTGDLNIHDVAFGDDKTYFVNSRFSCLSTFSDRYSFEPTWQPKFITELVPEDRCHLNGLAMRNGVPAFVTALAESDSVGGWRENKASSGVVIDVESGEVITHGLSMPHSPRLHRGTLYVLNSGKGELISVGTDGSPEVICRLPGYLRGLCFVNGCAVVGMCKIRERHIFGGLPIESENLNLICGLAVIDLQSGNEIARFEFSAGCEELFDIRFMPQVLRPNILNLQREASRQAFTAPQFSYWIRPQSLIENAS